MTQTHDPELIEAVYALRGQRSASVVAREFGLPSRNAVVGIWYREGRRRGDDPIAPQKATPQRRNMNEGRGHHQVARLPDKPAGAQAVANALAGTCRYPLWGDESPTHEFCGEPAEAHESYCAYHHAVTHIPMRHT